MSCLSNVIFSSIRTWVPQVMPVRFRYHADKLKKGPLVRRFGYQEPINQRGTLAHGGSNERIYQMPIYCPKDAWTERKAQFGQNDYIDILGDGNIHPSTILYNVPAWLKGFHGNEYQVALRKRKMWKRGIFPVARPTKWMHLQKRIRYLYKYLNRKTKTGMGST